MMDTLISFLIYAVIGIVVVAAIGFILGSLYHRAERDEAFVKTGMGGRKVIKDQGAIVLPVFQSISRVKLNTVKLVVERRENDAFITGDSMRVDVRAEFYVRVKGDVDGIALAAQTLGERVNDPKAIQELIEAKLVDALRSVAARFELQQLHLNRQEFVKAVQEAVASDLTENGLELESVSLTGLDQTSREFFSESNAFDAVGLAKLAAITEGRREERNNIERKTEVAIAERDLRAREETLKLDRARSDAELNLKRDIASKESETRAEAAAKNEAARRAEEEARISREQAVEVARQESAIGIAAKTEETAVAEAKAREAQALFVAAEEKVQTAKETAVADRAREIAVIRAKEDAESSAVEVTVRAAAEKEAAADRADAIRTEAEGKRDAAVLEAEAIRETGEAEAHARKLMIEAENSKNAEIIELEITTARLRMLPAAFEALMKPAEKIDSIRVFDTRGFSGGGSAGDGKGAGVGGNLADQLLGFVGNKPIVDSLLSEAGVTSGANLRETALGVAGVASSPNAAGDAEAAVAETEAHPS